MERSDWDARWSAGRIGFHQPAPHALLERHLPLFAGATSVLVPLAGKTTDLDLLSTVVPRVVANEFIEPAARAYFTERDLVPREGRRGTSLELVSGAITYLVDDFFALDAGETYDAFFDRAALVAVLPADRPRYVDSLVRLTHVGSVGLMITLEYDPSKMDGPPFSVEPDALHALFEPYFDLREVETRMDRVGSMEVRERAFRFERR